MFYSSFIYVFLLLFSFLPLVSLLSQSPFVTQSTCSPSVPDVRASAWTDSDERSSVLTYVKLDIGPNESDWIAPTHPDHLPSCQFSCRFVLSNL
jgi:hypothetical protein